jgi:hypothetical protein
MWPSPHSHPREFQFAKSSQYARAVPYRRNSCTQAATHFLFGISVGDPGAGHVDVGAGFCQSDMPRAGGRSRLQIWHSAQATEVGQACFGRPESRGYHSRRGASRESSGPGNGQNALDIAESFLLITCLRKVCVGSSTGRLARLVCAAAMVSRAVLQVTAVSTVSS